MSSVQIYCHNKWTGSQFTRTYIFVCFMRNENYNCIVMIKFRTIKRAKLNKFNTKLTRLVEIGKCKINYYA